MYHLCILTSHFYPIKSSCSSLFKDLIKSLLRENFQITIMTISGTHNKVREINTKKIKYIGIKNPYLKSSHKYLRVVGDIIAIQKLRNFYNKKNFCEFDQVIVYSPSIFWGIILSKLKKKIVSIKLGDLYPKWLIDHKMIGKFSLNFLFLKFFELLLYLQANKIYVQTKKDIKYISKYKKIFNFEIDVIYNWISTNPSPQEVKKNNKRKYVRFLFTGVISEAQNYNLLFKIIEYCRINNLKSTFYFFGSGTKKKSLQKITLSHKNVFFYNEKNIHKLDQIIQKCDICMSTLTNNFFSENFPGKILRYMVNNKPMLVHSPNNNFLKELINNHSLGLFSSEEADLYKNIDYIFSNFESFQKKGSYGLNIVKKYYSCENAKEKFFKNI